VGDQEEKRLLALCLGLARCLERGPVDREHDVAHAQQLALIVHVVRVRDVFEPNGAVAGRVKGDAETAGRVARKGGP